MTEHEFWQHIETLKGPGGESGYKARITALLQHWNPLDILRFQGWLSEYQYRAVRPELWAAAMLTNGGRCGDTAFRHFRSWLVAQGRQVFERALADPDSLADVPLRVGKQGPRAQLNALHDVPAKTFDRVTGGDESVQSEIVGELWRRDGPSEVRGHLFLGDHYWPELDCRELAERLPRLWALYGRFKPERDRQPREWDEDFSAWVREAEVPGLGVVRVGDTLVNRHDGRPGVVVSIVDQAILRFGQAPPEAYIEPRYTAKVREGESVWPATLDQHFRRPDRPEESMPPRPTPAPQMWTAADEAFQERIDAMQRRIEKAVKGKTWVVYSASPRDADDLPVDNLDEVAYAGSIRFESRPEDGEPPEFRSEVLASPTWMQLAVVANSMIGVTRDRDHCFLEGFEVVDEEGGVAIGVLWMGS